MPLNEPHCSVCSYHQHKRQGLDGKLPSMVVLHSYDFVTPWLPLLRLRAFGACPLSASLPVCMLYVFYVPCVSEVIVGPFCLLSCSFSLDSLFPPGSPLASCVGGPACCLWGLLSPELGCQNAGWKLCGNGWGLPSKGIIA